MQLNKAQQSWFWTLFASAWRAYCAGTGEHAGDSAAKDAWRKQQIRESTGETSLADVSRGMGFTKLMLHLAIIAGDDRAISHFATNEERVVRHLIEDRLSTLSDLEGRAVDFSYAAQIAGHMNVQLRLEDCPAELLMPIFMALDKHVRRIRLARNIETPTGRDPTQYRNNATRDFASGRAAKEIADGAYHQGAA